MTSVEELLVKTLKQNGYSLTKPRLITFNVINEKNPLTMKELVGHVGNKTDRASVYRTVSIYEEAGIIQRIYNGWKYKIELSDKFNEHHHHLTCKECGAITPIHDSQLEKFIEHIAQKEDFKTATHQLEIQGLCKKCSKTLQAIQ